jgi:hypothetical protein
MNQQTKQRIKEPTFISSFLPNKVHFQNPSADRGKHQATKPAPVFVANRLLAYGNPAGASEARCSAHSRKMLCKRTHSATMRSASTKLLIASLREERNDPALSPIKKKKRLTVRR